MIDAIFTILNFAVFAGLVVYYCKTSLIPMFKTKIIVQKTAEQDLVNQTIAASAEYRSLQEQMTQQDDLYASLDKKIERWHKKLNQENAAFLAHQQKQTTIMQTHVEKQMAFLDAFRTTKTVMPVLIEDVRSELHKHFAQTEHIQSYDQKTIDRLEGKHLAERAS